MKIDVEGAEYQVLKGALETLALTPKPVWLLEICLEEFHPQGMNPHFRNIFQLFWDNGYQAYTAAQSAKLVTPADVSKWVNGRHADSRTYNYVFVESLRDLLN